LNEIEEAGSTARLVQAQMCIVVKLRVGQITNHAVQS
jgi:hypothetical protein